MKKKIKLLTNWRELKMISDEQINKLIKQANIEQANGVFEFIKNNVKHAKFSSSWNFYIMEVPNFRNMYCEDLFEKICEILAENTILYTDKDDYLAELYIPTEFVKKNLQENLLKDIKKDF